MEAAAAGGGTTRGGGGEPRARTRAGPRPGPRQILPGCSSGRLAGSERDSGLRRLRGAAAAAPPPPSPLPGFSRRRDGGGGGPDTPGGRPPSPLLPHLAPIARPPPEQIPIPALARPLPRPAASPGHPERPGRAARPRRAAARPRGPAGAPLGSDPPPAARARPAQPAVARSPAP